MSETTKIGGVYKNVNGKPVRDADVQQTRILAQDENHAEDKTKKSKTSGTVNDGAPKGPDKNVSKDQVTNSPQ